MIKVYVAGHTGMVGSSIVRNLRKIKNFKIIKAERKQLNLLNYFKVSKFIKKNKPDIVILCAAKVGGILKNMNFPSEFYLENIKMQNNMIQVCHDNNINNLIFLGSSCIYPKYAKQPLREEYLLDGKLEPTNEAYALAKICGIKYCYYLNKQFGRKYFSVMPCNLYGPNDNFDIKSGHFIPGLINKLHNAKLKRLKQIEIFGSGKPRREIMHVDDLSNAIRKIINLLMNNNMKLNQLIKKYSFVNIGSGKDYTIKQYATILRKIVNVNVEFKFNKKYPDGTLRKLLDIKKIKSLGWKPSISLKMGIAKTYNWYKKNV